MFEQGQRKEGGRLGTTGGREIETKGASRAAQSPCWGSRVHDAKAGEQRDGAGWRQTAAPCRPGWGGPLHLVLCDEKPLKVSGLAGDRLRVLFRSVRSGSTQEEDGGVEGERQGGQAGRRWPGPGRPHGMLGDKKVCLTWDHAQEKQAEW